MNESVRWQWLKRPKWLVAISLALVGLGWLLWPVTIYQPGVSTFLIVEGDRSEPLFLGSVKIAWSPSPKGASEGVVRHADAAKQVDWIDRNTVWTYEGDLPKTLWFQRSNLLVSVHPTDRFSGFTRGDANWIETFERVARETDAAILTRNVGGREVSTERVFRGLLLLFPEGVDEGWRLWKQKARKRLAAWGL